MIIFTAVLCTQLFMKSRAEHSSYFSKMAHKNPIEALGHLDGAIFQWI